VTLKRYRELIKHFEKRFKAKELTLHEYTKHVERVKQVFNNERRFKNDSKK